jgi:hypothetical protein
MLQKRWIEYIEQDKESYWYGTNVIIDSQSAALPVII